MIVLFGASILVIVMKKRGGIHGVLGIRLIVDREIGTDEPMVGKAAVRDLLSPGRGIISDRFADSWGHPEQAGDDPDRDSRKAEVAHS